MTARRFNPSYVAQRPDVLALVPESAQSVLDVGCSVGTLGAAIKERNGATVIGIDLDPDMAGVARTRLDDVLIGDVEQLLSNGQWNGRSFDCIVFADLLEHLRDPWTVLARAHDLLSEGGTVVASIPNIGHYTTILNLLRGRWPYRERGLHDRTHLRFFTLHSIREIFAGAGLRITRIRRTYRIVERPHPVNIVARVGGFWPLRHLLTYQYLVVATRTDTAPPGPHDPPQ